jgi:hypothetical protein
MPHYILTDHYTRHGMTLAQGSILSTEAPEHGIFYISPADAERLVDEGLLQPYSPEVLTGARSKEPGWHPVERREREGDPGGDFRAPWG